MPKFQQNIARNACKEFKIIKRIFDIENKILVIFDPTLTSHRKLNKKSVFCGITSYGKNLHLVACATVCSKSKVMLLKGSKLRNRFLGCVTEIRILTLLLKTLQPKSNWQRQEQGPSLIQGQFSWLRIERASISNAINWSVVVVHNL